MTGRIDIRTTPARIDYSSQNARLDYRQPAPRMTIDRRKGGMEVTAKPPELTVDSSACFADEGSMSVSQFIAQSAQEGMQAIRDLASRLTQDGQAILRGFHTSPHIMADLARQKALPAPAPSEMRFIPSKGPEISFSDPVFEMDVRPETMQINWEVYPRAEITQAQSQSLTFRTQQYPSIEYTYIPPQALDVSA